MTLLLLVGEGTVEVELELRLELDGLLLHGELKPELEFSLPTGSTRTLPLFGGDGDVVALLAARATWLAREEEDEGMFCFLKQGTFKHIFHKSSLLTHVS
jgi:hypothetical protein